MKKGWIMKPTLTIKETIESIEIQIGPTIAINMKICFTNGCYDILHPGHLALFKYAKSLGDKLIVGIDSDKRIKQNKGPDRPINNNEDRKEMLLSLKYIDDVYVFDSDEELVLLIKKINPDVMIVGSDWKNKKVIGSEYAKSVKFFERIPKYSTTKIISSIAAGRNLS